MYPRPGSNDLLRRLHAQLGFLHHDEARQRMADHETAAAGTEFGVRKELVEGTLLHTTAMLPIMLCKAVCRQPAG